MACFKLELLQFAIVFAILGGGNSNIFYSSLPGEGFHFDEHIFQRGWFNNQPVIDCKKKNVYFISGVGLASPMSCVLSIEKMIDFPLKSFISNPSWPIENLKFPSNISTWQWWLGGWLLWFKNQLSFFDFLNGFEVVQSLRNTFAYLSCPLINGIDSGVPDHTTASENRMKSCPWSGGVQW